ncbi:hypothetical protein FOL46_006533 [Perkinsus olseni]|uniref:OTU domain-containing protein n=1 Tax=Perkinsus olseni TaxID=32597 RepID=A0A7J6LL42_PEROL|nr:hypothetical protein FOL46_006533 [Perkinsus olseni]
MLVAAAGSFAVQLKGVETFHDEFRQNCCDWLRDHQEMFQDFVDLTEEGFDDYGEYVTNMRQSTTWGGQVELTALCGAYDVAALVIRAEGVNYEIKAKEVDPEVTRCILLAYHDGEHYNSVVWEDGRQHTLAEARERFDSSVSPIAEPESEPKISRKKLKKKLQKDKRKNKERSAQKANAFLSLCAVYGTTGWTASRENR